MPSLPSASLLRACLTLAVVAGVLAFAQGCTAPPDGKVNLIWASVRDDVGFEAEVIRRFEKLHPDITVTPAEMPRDSDSLHNRCATYLVAEDDSVDIYAIDVVWTAEFASAGWAMPLDSWLSPEERAKFLDGPLAACTYEGHVYALPWYTDGGLLYYRKDLLDAAGIAPPRTWPALIAAAKRLQDERRSGFVFQAAQYEGLICNFLEHVWSNGGDVFDHDGRVVLDSPQNVEALQSLVDIIRKARITPTSITTYQEDESMRDFQNGSAVFLRNWPYAWGVTQKSGEPLLGKVGMSPLPHADRPGARSAACLGGWDLMISRYSKHPKEAFEFASFVTSEAIQRDRLIATSWLPTRIAPYLDAAVQKARPNARDMLAVLRVARPRPVTPYYSKLSDTIQIQVHRAITGEVSAQEALRTAAEQLRAIPGLEHAP